MFNKGDFHIHSTASDGRLSPSEVVEKAYSLGLDILALTDHDTVNGIESALEASRNFNIKLIPGVELSTTHNGEDIHVLGYFKDNSYNNPELKMYFNNLKTYRSKRARQIVQNLKTFFNIDLDYEELARKCEGVIARPHLAQAIVDSGYESNWQYIFNTILGNTSPAYVPNKRIGLEEGIKLLRSYNAFVVLAHPILIKRTPVEDIIKFDFDGMEAIYPLNSNEDTERFIALAKLNNKIITAGSDFHGIKNDGVHSEIASSFLSGDMLDTFISRLDIK